MQNEMKQDENRFSFHFALPENNRLTWDDVERFSHHNTYNPIYFVGNMPAKSEPIPIPTKNTQESMAQEHCCTCKKSNGNNENVFFCAFESVTFHAPKIVIQGEIYNSQIQDMMEHIDRLRGKIGDFGNEEMMERIQALEKKNEQIAKLLLK
jgi:hypothetical protein